MFHDCYDISRYAAISICDGINISMVISFQYGGYVLFWLLLCTDPHCAKDKVHLIT